MAKITAIGVVRQSTDCIESQEESPDDPEKMEHGITNSNLHRT